MTREFNVLEPVLYRENETRPWTADFYIRENMLLGARIIYNKSQVIPFKGNEHLANTTEEYEEKN